MKTKANDILIGVLVFAVLSAAAAVVWYNGETISAPVVKHRSVGPETIRRQIDSGNLSGRKAMHFRVLE